MKRSPNGSKIGFIGGVIGIILGILSFLYASIVTLVTLFRHAPLGTFVSSVLGVVFGILFIVGAGIARKDSLVGGIVLIVFSIAALIYVPGLYVIASVITLIGGLVAIYDYVR